MESHQFKAWRKSHGWTQAEAAKEIGISTPSVILYERGSRPEDGRPVIIPKHIALACAAISVQVGKPEPSTGAPIVSAAPRVKRVRIEGPIEVLSIKGPLEIINRFKDFANSNGHMSYWSALRDLLERAGK